MYRIRGRLNTAIDFEANNGELKDKCNKVMNYYKESDRAEFTDLTEEQIRQVKEYWKPYEFVYKVDPYVHRFYTNVTGNFDVRYIPEDLQKYIMSKFFMDQDYIEAFKDKNYTEMLLSDLTAPRTLVHKIAGAYRDSEYNKVTLDEAVEIISDHKKTVEEGKVALIKPTMGTSRGSGLVTISKNTTKNEIKSMLDTWRDDILVQTVIIQHEDLKQIHPTSVNSIRVMSMLKDDEFQVVSSCLRVGRDGSFVDNWGRGGLSCGIEKDGTCNGPFYDKFGVAYETHPDGFDPVGFKVPGYEELIRTIRKNHLKFPQLKVISWDFAIGEDGTPVFIEWNMKGDTQLHQMSNGPLYGEQNREILDSFFSNVYKEIELDGINYNEFIDHVEVAECDETLENVTIKSEINGKAVTVLAGRCFFRHENLKNVIVPDTVESINYQSFFGCYNLEDIKLSKNLKIIGDGAFANCKSIKDFGIMENVELVDQRAFLNCTAMEQIKFGDKLSKISLRGISGCTALKLFSAGKGIKRIEERAFQGCTQLSDFTVDTKGITALARAFFNCESLNKSNMEGFFSFTGINCFKGCKE